MYVWWYVPKTNLGWDHKQRIQPQEAYNKGFGSIGSAN